ncbi:IclR family transcriptional regulator [Parasalinivibrio latis]|uniref:IclR family transcriptional regulator n=1 Tax=Parasalinivibrio latis TaxID=2952610 RepID=UPI0030DE6EAC
MKEGSKTEYRAPAVSKALDIIEFLCVQDEPLTKKEIAEALGKTVNEIFRMLEELKRRNYVVHDVKSGKYWLSMKLYQIANHHRPIERLTRACAVYLKRLAQETQQSCHVTVFDSNKMLVIAQSFSPYMMGFGVKIGAQIDVHASGSGLVYLSSCTDDEVERLLTLGNMASNEKDQIKSALIEVRDKTFYIGASEVVPGVTDLSFPVYSVNRQLEAVLTVPYLKMDHLSLQHYFPSIEESRASVASYALKISESLGFIVE